MKDMLQSPCAKIRQAIGATPWPDQSEPWRPLDFIFGVIDLSQSTAADSARPGPSSEKESVMSSMPIPWRYSATDIQAWFQFLSFEAKKTAR